MGEYHYPFNAQLVQHSSFTLTRVLNDWHPAPVARCRPPEELPMELPEELPTELPEELPTELRSAGSAAASSVARLELHRLHATAAGDAVRVCTVKREYVQQHR